MAYFIEAIKSAKYWGAPFRPQNPIYPHRQDGFFYSK